MSEVIVALDMPEVDDAFRLLDAAPAITWVKVGSTLHLRGGEPFIARLKARGLKVFLDLKWHDIPHQVSGAVGAAEGMGVDLATVHLSGGRPMLEAAVQASSRLRLAGVSVLTSHDPPSYREAMGRSGSVNLINEVERLVSLGVDCGLTAFVCSPLEVGAVRSMTGPETWRVVPGIRPAADPSDDQQRTAGPADAVSAGATHLVVGRPVWRAETPAQVYEQMLRAARNSAEKT